MPANASIPTSSAVDLGDHDDYLRWVSHGANRMVSEAPDGDLYVLTEHPQVPGKWHVTKGFDLDHTSAHPHVSVAAVTGLIAAQRAAEDDANQTFPRWTPSAAHPVAQRHGTR